MILKKSVPPSIPTDLPQHPNTLLSQKTFKKEDINVPHCNADIQVVQGVCGWVGGEWGVDTGGEAWRVYEVKPGIDFVT